MKKCARQDGYVLAYVMVVILVFATVIASCFSAAEQNYRAQIAAERRLQERYDAEGVMERIMAQLQNGGMSNVAADDFNISGCPTVPPSVPTQYTVTVTPTGSGTKVTAKLTVTPVMGNADDPAAIQEYAVKYISYQLESVSAPEGGDAE